MEVRRPSKQNNDRMLPLMADLKEKAWVLLEEQAGMLSPPLARQNGLTPAHVRAFLCFHDEFLLLMPQSCLQPRATKDLVDAVRSCVPVLTHARASAMSGLEVARTVAEGVGDTAAASASVFLEIVVQGEATRWWVSRGRLLPARMRKGSCEAASAEAVRRGDEE